MLDTNLMCCHAEFKEDAGCAYTFNDNFANCDTMFRDKNPKRCIWVIGILSLLGAAFVIAWRLFYKEKNVVQTILLMHVAVADGLMGVYLMTVGIVDAVWSGEYYLHDFEWRTGFRCQVVGGMSVMSSQVSIMILTLLSIERVKKIVFPYQFKGLTRKKAHKFCFAIWVIAFIIAYLPTFGIRYFHDPDEGIFYYGKSVVCIPLQLNPEFISGWEYSIGVFVGMNLALVIVIVVAYCMILWKTCVSKRRLTHQGTRRERAARARSADAKREMSLAKRVFWIILTDLVSWIPIVVIGFKSVLNEAFEPPDDIAVWIAVFVLPINSAMNPVLYTFSTPQVQSNLFYPLLDNIQRKIQLVPIQRKFIGLYLLPIVLI